MQQLRAELAEHTMYELLGGEAGIHRLVDAFYDHLAADADLVPIRVMHAEDLSPMRLRLFEFLSGWLGGPPLFIQRTGSPCLTEAHAPYPIDRPAREQWLTCMERAMTDAKVADRYREALTPGFEGIADMLTRA